MPLTEPEARGAAVTEAPASAENPGRRPRFRAVLLVLLATAVIVAMGLTWYLQAYQPIEPGSQGTGVVVEHVENNSLTREDLRHVEPVLSADEVQIPYRSAGRFRYAFSIRNGGRWSITVTDVPLSPRVFALGDGVRMGTENNFQGSPPMTRFRSFVLPPGKERYIEVSYRLNDCGLPPKEPLDNTFGWSAHRIEYEIFGVSKHMELEIDPAIIVRYNSKGFQPGCERTNGSR